jgi:hypothetical protein
MDGAANDHGREPVLLCSKVEAPTRMFTADKAYPVAHRDGARLICVVDDLGHERVISADTLRFIIANHDPDFPGGFAPPLYAYFRWAYGENP